MSSSNTTSDFADVLHRFVVQSGYTAGQLARQTGIPKQTIISWLDGRVRRPRSYSDLLSLSRALRLTQPEVQELMAAAGHELQGALPPPVEAAPAITTMPGAPFQAIAEPPYFVGREELLSKIETAVRLPNSPPVICLHGMGGVGKTAIAAKLAYRLRGDFPDGILWAQAGQTPARAILGVFAHAYNEDISTVAELNARSQMVRQMLANRRALIILDDVHSGSEVEPLLPPSTGGCRVVVTTRRRNLFLPCEVHFIEIPLFDVAEQESMALFRRVLGDQRVHLEQDDLAATADLLGHLPLAVAIAATRLALESDWTAAEFRQRLAQEENRLSALVVDNRSVLLTLQVSLAALLPSQRRVFESLAVFGVRRFHAEVVAYVNEISIAQAQDDLRRLFSLSLIEPARPITAVPHKSYRLHPLISDYARLQAKQHNRPDLPMLSRLRDFYIHFAERHHHQPTLLNLESANIMAALRLSEEAGLPPPTLDGNLIASLQRAGIDLNWE